MRPLFGHKSKVKVPAPQEAPHPEVLAQLAIPKVLHGKNPRTSMGKKQWDELRQTVYESTGYTCYCCGVPRAKAKFHPRLEAHEVYDFDFKSYTLTCTEIIPLCHACHMFVHSKFVWTLVSQKKFSKERAVEIHQHAAAIIKATGTPIPGYKIQSLKAAGVNTDSIDHVAGIPAYISNPHWKMYWDGEKL